MLKPLAGSDYLATISTRATAQNTKQHAKTMKAKPATPAQTKKDWKKTKKNNPKKAAEAVPATNSPTEDTTPTQTTVESVPEVTLPTTEPTPTTTPASIELVKDGESGKKYVSKTAPDSKYHLRDRSDVAKPVAVVHGICAANPDLTRKEVIALCLEAGVNKNTAMTQYSLWKRKQNNLPPRGIPGMVAFDADGNECPVEE